MKTKTLKKNKVNVITLGCSKNLFDSEVTMTQLKANGYEVEHEAKQDDSEIVIINTCGFIDNAKQESIDTIIRYADAKAEGFDQMDLALDSGVKLEGGKKIISIVNFLFSVIRTSRIPILTCPVYVIARLKTSVSFTVHGLKIPNIIIVSL